MNCFCAKTRQASRGLTSFFEDHLRPAGLTSTQFELLSQIHYRPGVSQTALAEHNGTDQTTLSRNLRLLVTNQWVTARRSKQDARQSGYTLTAGGEKTWQTGYAQWKKADAAMRRRLGDDGPAAFVLLDKLLAAASAAA